MLIDDNALRHKHALQLNSITDTQMRMQKKLKF